MLIQLFGLIDGVGTLADWLVGGVELLNSAGMPRGADPAALVVGGTAGVVAGGGAVYDGGGGSNVGRDDATQPPLPTSVQARRDAAKEYYKSPRYRFDRALLNATDVAQKWAEKIVGEKLIEVSRPKSGGAAPHA